MPLYLDDDLLYVAVGGADEADGDEEVGFHEVAGHALNGFGESGGEHHRLTILFGRHPHLTHHLTDGALEAHVQHTIRCMRVGGVGEGREEMV